VPNVYGDLEALQSKILELFFIFLEGWGLWGTRVGVSGLEKSWLKFLLNASYSGWAFFIQLGIVMGWDGFQFNLLVFRCMIGTRLKALM